MLIFCNTISWIPCGGKYTLVHNRGCLHKHFVSSWQRRSWELELVVRILGQYIVYYKTNRNLFLVDIFVANQYIQIFLDLLEDSHCKLQWDSSRNLTILVRDENFDQKYVSNCFVFFCTCIYFPSMPTISFSTLEPKLPMQGSQNIHYVHFIGKLFIWKVSSRDLRKCN